MSSLKFISDHFGDGHSSFLHQELSRTAKSDVTYRIVFDPVRRNASEHNPVGLDKIELKWHFLLFHNGIEIYTAYASVIYGIEENDSIDNSSVVEALANSHKNFLSNIKRVRKSIFVIPSVLSRHEDSPEAISYTQEDLQSVLKLLSQ